MTDLVENLENDVPQLINITETRGDEMRQNKPGEQDVLEAEKKEERAWVTRRRIRKKGKGKKRRNKVRRQKTKEERLAWANTFKADMVGQYGLYPGCSGSGAIRDLYNIIDEFVQAGDSVSGKIDFLDAPYGGREIHYILTNTKGINNTVNMLLKDRSLSQRTIKRK